MGSYKFYPAADRRQDEIWSYTLTKHGQEQAEKYIIGLHNYLKQLAGDKMLWKKLPQALATATDINDTAYFAKYEYHFIYFRELPNKTIGVISILHEVMDLPYQLGRDLRKLNQIQ